MVLVGEATAWPPEHGNIQLLERSHHVISNAPGIRDGRVFPHPDSFVNTTPEMLGKLSVNIAIDDGAGLIAMHGDRSSNGFRSVSAGQERRACQNGQARDEFQKFRGV
jgi:hypothetical protein